MHSHSGRLTRCVALAAVAVAASACAFSDETHISTPVGFADRKVLALNPARTHAVYSDALTEVFRAVSTTGGSAGLLPWWRVPHSTGDGGDAFVGAAPAYFYGPTSTRVVVLDSGGDLHLFDLATGTLAYRGWVRRVPVDDGNEFLKACDVDVAPDGTIYYVSAQKLGGLDPVVALTRAAPGGAKSYLVVGWGAAAASACGSVAYDPLENNVAYHDDNEREVRRYAPDLSGPPTSRFATGLWDTRHIAAWGGQTALAAEPCLSCDNVISLRDADGVVTDERVVTDASALALDPPPLPLNAQGDTDTFLWMLGNHDGEGVHRYRLILAD